MFVNNTFGKTIDLLSKAMDVATMRREVIADNIANSEVPNFKRSEVNFETALKRALESEKTKPAVLLDKTSPDHIGNDTEIDYKTIEPERVVDYLTTSKANGNNVDPEVELMDSVNNQMSYTLYAQAINYEYNQVLQVLRSS